MRVTSLLASSITVVALALATPSVATAATPSHAIMKANMEEVTNYRLTESFLRSDFAYALETAKHPCRHTSMRGFALLKEARSQPIDQVAARFDTQPGVHAMLVKHDLTARQAVVGGFAMMMTSLTYMSGDAKAHHVEVTGGPTQHTAAMKANLAFYKAHLPEINAFHQKMGAIAQQIVDENGGKMPACMMRELKQH